MSEVVSDPGIYMARARIAATNGEQFSWMVHQAGGIHISMNYGRILDTKLCGLRSFLTFLLRTTALLLEMSYNRLEVNASNASSTTS
jgi:hypothetical protein